MNINSCKKLTAESRVDRYYSISFVAIVLAFGFLSVAGLKPVPVSLSELASGTTAKAIEVEYDESFVIKQFGTNAWAAIEYRFFKEGRPGVIVGKDGWLFSSEEFQDQPAQQQALVRNIAYISWARQRLLEQNVQLLVVPIPAKARVYREYIGSEQPSPNHQSLYAQFMAALERENVMVADSLLAMQQHINRDDDLLEMPLYLRTDTHWSAEGAHVIAKQVASTLREKFGQLELNKKTFLTEAVGKRTHQGDLINFLPLTPWFNQFLPKMDKIRLYKTYSKSDEASLFSDNTINVALIGTSYSASSDWNFDGSLKSTLSADLANFSEPGLGPMTPMVRFLDQHLATLPRLSVAIWEVPERYLQVHYSQAYATMDIADKSIAAIARSDTRITKVRPEKKVTTEPLADSEYTYSTDLAISPKEDDHETFK